MNLKYKRKVLKITPAFVWLQKIWRDRWKDESGSPIGSGFVPSRIFIA